MTGEEHRNIVNQIMGFLSPENQATGSELLTQLSNDYTETLSNVDRLTTSNAELTTNNETLRNVNAKLFLQVGETQQKVKHPEQQMEESKKKPIDYNTLFNEKGDLM